MKKGELSVGKCEVWGVLNVTPDSFSDGGRYHDFDAAIDHAKIMLAQGADVIDVGGESSRPQGRVYGDGASLVSDEDEIQRVVPVIRTLTQQYAARVSVDTVKSTVARQAIEAGATIVNDVSCGASAELVNLIAETEVEYVLMHTRHKGEVTGDNIHYEDVVRDVVSELLDTIERVVASGVRRKRIWIDPGIGFAKTAKQSLKLLADIDELVVTGYPVLVGPSRKSFVAEIAPNPKGDKPGPDQREGGTAAAVTASVFSGVRAVRVHDVALMRQVVLVAHSLRKLQAKRSSYHPVAEAVW